MKYYWVVGSPVGLGKLGGFEPSAREKINTPFILDFFKIRRKGGGVSILNHGLVGKHTISTSKYLLFRTVFPGETIINITNITLQD